MNLEGVDPTFTREGILVVPVVIHQGMSFSHKGAIHQIFLSEVEVVGLDREVADIVEDSSRRRGDPPPSSGREVHAQSLFMRSLVI